MALKVKAREQYQNVGKYADTYRYVMMPELYTALTQDKVIKEAALRSGVSRGVMQACWDAAGRRDAGLLGCSRRGNQGMGDRGSQRGSAWTGHHALRTARQECREGGRGKGRPDYQSPHHLHSRHGAEGRVGQDRCADHLLRPRRQGGEASYLNLRRGGRP